VGIDALVPGLPALHRTTLGEPRVRVAVLDGPVDLTHPCFAGADLGVLPTLVTDPPGDGAYSRHGTHVTSLIFGQPGSPVAGAAPYCRGLIAPVFRDDQPLTPQLDLARAIEQAVGAGADVISISAGEPAPTGEADPLLGSAIDLCRERGVLVIAAVGNDGCACLQVPAALDWVLAVGAATADGEPHDASNWGAEYRTHGILAPGVDIAGAAPGGATTALTGSSIATAIVAGLAALLLSLQYRLSRRTDPATVRQALLETATPGSPDGRSLAGLLNLSGAVEVIHQKGTIVSETPSAGVCPAAEDCGCGCGGAKAKAPASPPLVYAIGSVGYDFGTEARRDGFRQQMGMREEENGGETRVVPANPYDPTQLSGYLRENPWASGKLIWTLNLDQTPIYALEAEPALGMVPGDPLPGDRAGTYPPVSYVHKLFHDAIVGQMLPLTDSDHVSRVSIPGVLTNRTVRLFSGQVVPVVTVETRGLYSWNESALVAHVTEQVTRDRADRGAETGDDMVEQTVRSFLDKVYYQFRNLGQSSSDRALNYAATNVFVFAQEISNGILSGQRVPRQADEPEPMYMLDTIEVSRSPVCRMDSDCWDVRVTFFDPENDRRARSVLLFAIDVSDVLPVSLAPTRQYFVGS
jgi:hypothetical protein